MDRSTRSFGYWIRTIELHGRIFRLQSNPKYLADEGHTSFITDRWLYCYKVLPFRLKNVGATYQRLVNKMCIDLNGMTMEVYVDDMLEKSFKTDDQVELLDKAFQILQRYRMRWPYKL